MELQELLLDRGESEYEPGDYGRPPATDEKPGRRRGRCGVKEWTGDRQDVQPDARSEDRGDRCVDWQSAQQQVVVEERIAHAVVGQSLEQPLRLREDGVTRPFEHVEDHHVVDVAVVELVPSGRRQRH